MTSSDGFMEHIGNELWSPSTSTTAGPASILSNKVVMFYFSAHWCPPCRQFTPKLREFYQSMKARSEVEDFELVFCSLDRTEEEYKSYTSKMPWWCLPHSSKDAIQRLARQYGAQGIPHLVIIDKDGSTVLSQDGVEYVATGADPQEFPWRPKPMAEFMPKEYLAPKEGRLPLSDLDDKYLMLYFSAHWCPPCKQFTPKLSKAYTELKQHRAKEDDFELLFVSSDRDQAAFDEYFGEMSFGALPYEERNAKDLLSRQLGVQGIPTLIMLGPMDKATGDRPVISTKVRNAVDSGDFLNDFPFIPKPYGDVSACVEEINSSKCLVVFHEAGDDDEQDETKQAVIAAANKYSSEKKGVHFYWSFTGEGVAGSIRSALELGPANENPAMVLVDIPDEGGYYVSSETDITTDSILAFVASPGERRQMKA